MVNGQNVIMNVAVWLCIYDIAIAMAIVCSTTESTGIHNYIATYIRSCVGCLLYLHTL